MIDLHTHSTFSDGSDSPERLVELAAAAGCMAMALTDHDGTDGVPEAAKAAAKLGLEFLPGCEVSCGFEPGTMHMLLYFVETGDGPFQDELNRLRHERQTRNERLMARLQQLGLPVTYDDVVAAAGGAVIGRPHFASALVERGAATSIQDAFDRYLKKGAPAYIPKVRVDAPTAISLARSSGGIAVLAHPLSLGLEGAQLEALIAELRRAGLGGLECYYSRYSKEARSLLVALAQRHDLVPTGGSDYHGRFKPDLSVGTGAGDLDVPDGVLDDLRNRSGERDARRE